MAYDICYDISALLILIIVSICTAGQYVEMTPRKRRFRRLLGSMLFGTFMDIVRVLFVTWSTRIPVSLNMGCLMLRHLALAFAAYCYISYSETYLSEDSVPRWLHWFNIGLMGAFVLVNIVNLSNGFMFYFDEQCVYHRGPWVLLVFLFPLYYFLYGFVIMSLNHKQVGLRQYLTTMAIVPMVVVAAILQYGPMERYMVVFFPATLCVILVFFNLETPDFKQLELARREASEASRTKSEFLANMSHEIRTPMNAVVGMCELILRENDISDTVREYCYNIKNSGKSLLSIINDILDFSKIESGKMELVEDEFNIASTLNDVINMAVVRKGSKQIEIIVHVDPNIPSGLIGDEVRIRQIIINLVTNAIKYSTGGCVSIRVSQKKRDYGINLSVAVADTGIGIKEDDLEKLFSSFQQVDTKKNRAVEGTGLGLAITKRLIEQMGGFVNVDSVYGKGSLFRFTIPMRVSSEAPFLSVREPEKAVVAGYLDVEKYPLPMIAEEYGTLFEELRRGFGITIDVFTSMQELEAALQDKPYSHLFTAREEYAAHFDFFNRLPAGTRMIVVQDREDPIDLPAGTTCVYKPFYALSVASVLNNEGVLTNLSAQRRDEARFIAPTARVLVVDDNAMNLSVAEGLMRPYRMQVITAYSGPAAITMLRSRDIDLVFMDHMMPGMDGVEATQLIRAMPGEYYKRLPIVALTANAVEGARNMFLESGFDGFLAKPIEITALDRILKTWLPKEKLEQPQEGQEAERAASAGPADLLETELFSGSLGLSYLGGSLETYYEVLAKYADRGSEKLELIQSLFEAKDWNNYVIEVHALKSSSLTIGSKPLSELAKELEAAGKNACYSLIEEKNATLLELYAQVIELARRQADKRETPRARETETNVVDITPEKLDEYVEQLRAACDELDGDAVAQICREASLCAVSGTPLKPFFDEIKACAEDYEFDEACEKAQAVSQRVRG